jgi:hypothetical protein
MAAKDRRFQHQSQVLGRFVRVPLKQENHFGLARIVGDHVLAALRKHAQGPVHVLNVMT